MAFPHGIMFHHFHDSQHAKGQGAISAGAFERILDDYADRILPADAWMKRAAASTLRDTDVCLTFDDALRCQMDIAFPILKQRGITAFWFVYSSVFSGTPDFLEVYRHFRTVHFRGFDEFCDSFVSTARRMFEERIEHGLCQIDVSQYLSVYSFYTYNDRLFRFIRDQVLTPAEYDQVMADMMAELAFEPNSVHDRLWMGNNDLKALAEHGNIIGLHSYSHPIRIERMTPAEQRSEYEKNAEHIASVVGAKPSSMSHPCNSYSSATLSILRDIGVQIGFRANMVEARSASALEIPREDHANIAKRLCVE